MTIPAIAAHPVQLYAASSLRSALTEVGAAFEAATAVKVQVKFGASGTLRGEQRLQRQPTANIGQSLLQRSCGRVDHDMIDMPRPVHARAHFVPSRRHQAGKIGLALLDLPPMFVNIGADDLGL